jgi:Flp pilus assembly protein TadG
MPHFRRFASGDERGTTAVEFAIVAPVFISLVVGSFYLCMCLFVAGSLHFAVEDGARCASVKTAVCKDAASTVSYTSSRYLGLSAPTFTYQAAACGNSVSGSIDYPVNLGITQITVPLTASACFP